MRAVSMSTIRRYLAGTGTILVMLIGIAIAYGQEATERFIPIGQSPGLSSTQTDIAEISDVNPELETVTLTAAAETWSVSVGEQTRIWLDRSRLGLTSLTGEFTDLKEGLLVEVKYEDPERKLLADWIKVAPAQAE